MSLFDLSGIFNVQRSILYDISGVYTGANHTRINTAVNDLQTKLNSLNTNLTSAGADVDAALTRQKDVKYILDTEKSRLDAKKSGVDNAHSSTLRSLELTENTRKRQAGFIKVFVVVILLTILYIVLIQVNKIFPFPGYILETVMIILFSLGGIYLYIVLRDIYRRSNINYDKINLTPPTKIVGPDELQKAQQQSKEAGNLLGSIFGDFDSTLASSFAHNNYTEWAPGVKKYIKKCPADQIYEYSTGNCIATANCTSANSNFKCGPNGGVQVCVLTASHADCLVDGFDVIGGVVKPYAPSEFIHYSIAD
jgi:hypothetical protein